MQKSITFVKKSLKTNMLKIKKYRKVRDHFDYTVKYRGTAHNICNLNFIMDLTMIIILS